MNIFICRHCGDERKSNPSLINHERLCKKNPNRDIANTDAARKAASVKVNCRYCNNKLKKSNLYVHEKACIENRDNQKECPTCGCLIPKNKKFCGLSCSATYNNKKRGPRSEETKEKIGNSLTGRTHSHGNGVNHPSNKICKIQFKNCIVCDNVFMVKNNYKDARKTCSRDCQIDASVRTRPYQNGSRKTTWYFNRNENKEVLLESSWEVIIAEKLDELNLKWIRPDHIKWKDDNNKTRYYFPDFLLTDHDLYLDPKNPYCMEKDEEKMNVISEKINIIYGDINYILDYIETECRP